MLPPLRNPPSLQYAGLTIILSNPSRNDTKKLLIDPDTTAGYFFDRECLYPHLNRWQCDIRLPECKDPLLPGTKAVLLLGQFAMSKWTNANTTIDEQRGSPQIVNGIPCISSFTAQDAIDPQDFERKLNKDYKGIEDLDEDQDEDQFGDLLEAKGRGRTDRKNYRFWLKHDCGKIIQILQNNGNIPSHSYGEPTYHLWPDANFLIHHLQSKRGEYLYFDMETDFISADMRCFAYCFSSDPTNVYVVPWLTTDYKKAYDKNHFILRALSVAIRDNVIVAHNGAHFDFLVLLLKYATSIHSCYDTMVSQNRIYPTLEKSLGHCISLETFLPYHKNEGIHGYFNASQAEQLYSYCGKDVFSMFLVHQAQLKRAAMDEGLKASIKLANDSIEPYLCAALMGIAYSEEERAKFINNSDRLLTQYMRIMRSLTGDSVLPLISNQKCTKYFHEQLGYDVVGRSKKTGNPSLSEDNLYKLALKYNNPVISFLIKYRQKKLQSSTLQFKPYRT